MKFGLTTGQSVKRAESNLASYSEGFETTREQKSV